MKKLNELVLRRLVWQLNAFIAAICIACGLLGCGSGGDDSSDSESSSSTNTEEDDSIRSSTEIAAADVPNATFEFTYAADLVDLTPGDEVSVWIPIAPSNDHQQVQVLSIDVPGEYKQHTDPNTGNRMAFFKAVADDEGRVSITVNYKVVRKQVTKANYADVSDEDKSRYLLANSMVPLGGKPESLFLADKKLSGTNLEKAHEIYSMVESHVDYDKPEGGEWGRGDAVWVCDSKHGNCTDFHSLFISLCRTTQIPARFEIGFPIPKDGGAVGGYHCWGTFVHDDHWIPVDISEADKHPEKFDFFFGNLSPDRVSFSNGRDLTLVPEQQGGPLNFFVYPYAEVDGQPHTQIEKKFHVEMVEEGD